MQAVCYGCFLILWICFSAVAKAQNEITCKVPVIQNGWVTNQKAIYNKDDVLSFACAERYIPVGRPSTCTNHDWRPKPQCEAIEGFCQRPVLENGYLIPDKSNLSVIHYGCIPGYKPLVDGWWGELTCTHSVWSDNPKCIASDEMCNPPPRVEYATITSKYKTKYAHLSKVEFQCTELYKIEGNREVTCRHGTWSAVPKCIRSKCSSPEDKVNNAVLVHKKEGPYENGAKVDYECEDTFIPGDETKAICINGQWTYPHCTSPQKTCQKPPVPENGDIVSTEVEDGETVVTYQCKLHYKLKDERKVRCHEGEWEPFPVCIGPCVIEKIHPKYNLRDPKEKIYVLEGEKIKIRCKREHYINKYWVDEVEVKCEDGEITGYRSCQHLTTFY